MWSRLPAALLLLAAALSPVPSFAVDAGPSRSGHPLVVCLGDSLTAGFGVASGKAWPELVEDSLRKDGWPELEIVNAGISGSMSSSAVARLKSQLAGTRPDIVLLALGANDGLRGVPPEETKDHLAAAIELAQQNNVRVLLAGMKTLRNRGDDYAARFTETFSSLAREKKIPLIPFLLEGVAGDAGLNLPDRLHPNEQGYEVVARTVAQYLRPMLEDLVVRAPPVPSPAVPAQATPAQ